MSRQRDTDVDSVLAKQDLATLDVTKLSATSPEILARQATMTIGTIGHVAHGKSTVVQALSGRKTQTHSDEKKLNITIDLGYAGSKIYRAEDLPEPDCYVSRPVTTADTFTEDGHTYHLQRHIAMIDCPGHDVLMETMISGAVVMDAAMLIIASNEKFPQAQTVEHMRAVDMLKVQKIIVLQNKIDLIDQSKANQQREQIKEYFATTLGINAPIIPISAQLRINMGYLLQYLCHLAIPSRDLTSKLLMVVVRSFDNNRPGEFSELQGATLGGNVVHGVIKVGQQIELQPGYVIQEGRYTRKYRPYITTVRALEANEIPLQYAIPGGSVAVNTGLDPSLGRKNRMKGVSVGDVGSLPEVYHTVITETSLFYEVPSEDATKKAHRVEPLVRRQEIELIFGSRHVTCTVKECVPAQGNKAMAALALHTLVCCSVGDVISIMRKIENSKRLVGHATIIRGTPAERLR